MSLLSPVTRSLLLANARQSRAWPGFDPRPLVRLVERGGPARWLCTELSADGAWLYGLADTGSASPEPGYFSLSDVSAFGSDEGARVVRDLRFFTPHRLSAWCAAARLTRSIDGAQILLERLADELGLTRGVASPVGASPAGASPVGISPARNLQLSRLRE
ncbi:DUF2958 domain-containing protein [Novosphingobium profundi]|uniref:DUF2958 domain-containing protein n=1 Tax=Novosphingobium profundi TaxID=1774954 RepID=UPI001CFD395C|nr:DUF2958 domain-containing protein [Novosphingobium profundi]